MIIYTNDFRLQLIKALGCFIKLFLHILVDLLLLFPLLGQEAQCGCEARRRNTLKVGDSGGNKFLNTIVHSDFKIGTEPGSKFQGEEFVHPGTLQFRGTALNNA